MRSTTFLKFILVSFFSLIITLANSLPEGHYWRTRPIHMGPEVDRFIKAAVKSSLETNEGWVNRDYIVRAAPSMRFDEMASFDRRTRDQDVLRLRDSFF